MGQGRPEGMGPGMGPGGPGQRGDGEFRGRGPRSEQMQQIMERQKEKRAKKYRKVLTPEQYKLWESVEMEREMRRQVDMQMETPR